MLMDGFAPKIQATFFLEHQWMPLDEWKKIMEKWVIEAKWYKSDIDHKCCIFSKKNMLGKKTLAVSMLIPRCQCWDFQMAFKMCHINYHNNVVQKLN